MVKGRYLADLMLMRLARWLRMAGQDVSNPPEGADDSDLLEIALAEERTLLTRDRVLARRCEKAGAGCLLIISSDLDEQLRELEDAGIALELNPERCTLCNGPLEEVGSSEIVGEPALSEEGSALWRCERCGKLYWRGSHWRGIRKRLEGEDA
ncbi:MAG TPA: Mut7-C RNAse domain-containing protein [Methanothrix sp.]|nr:Mut7-C RNAse domain-containing protein [Methanothrix sp.]